MLCVYVYVAVHTAHNHRTSKIITRHSSLIIWTSNQRTMKWVRQRQHEIHGQCRWKGIHQEKNTRTNKRTGFDINQANYLGNNFKKKNEWVATALQLMPMFTCVCQTFKWHTINAPHTHASTALTFQTHMAYKNANEISITISLIAYFQFLLWTSILAVDSSPPPIHFVKIKSTHALAFSQ